MGNDVSIDEMIARWHEANTPPGEPVGLDKERMMKDIEQILLPSKEKPVAATMVLGQMVLDFLEPLLLKCYSKKPSYPPLPILRATLLQKKKKLTGRGLPRYLTVYSDEALRLGFPEVDGKPKIPSHEQFRTFIQQRINWDEIRDAILTEFIPIAKKHAIKLGSQCTEDSTMIESVENDPEAKYNGHYDKTGYKEDLITCRGTGLPILNMTIGATNCEGHVLIPQIEHQITLGIPIEDIWVDGTYATFENIAIANVLLGVRLHYQVQEDWVVKKEGTPEYIKKLYQQFWRDSEARSNADLNEMMVFLTRKGRLLVDTGRCMQRIATNKGAWGDGKRTRRGRPTREERDAQEHFYEGERTIKEGMRFLEPVGAYFRNIVMEAAKKDPDGMKKDKGKRQWAESINNHLKNDLGLQEGLRVKGMRKVHIHNTLGCIFLLLIGLHKVRNGVIKDLASLVGIE